MSLRISTNLASLAAQNALATQNKRQEHASQALASGSRIVRSSDDPAGLAIAEGLRSEIRSSAQAKSNAQNAISVTQIGEGGLAETANLITRLRELAVQSASDTVGDKEREYIQQEADGLSLEIDRIAKTTKFGNQKLLDGTSSSFEFQIDSGSDKNSVITFKNSGSSTASDLALDSVDLTSKGSSKDVISKADEALDKVSKMRAGFGALQSRLDSVVSTLDSKDENLKASRSRIIDSDMAKESAELASASVLQNAATSVLAQANQQPYVAMKLVG